MQKSTLRDNTELTRACQNGAESMPRRSGMIHVPSHDAIALRAYQLYLRNGSKPGRCQENWAQAEKALTRESQSASAATESSSEYFPDAEGDSQDDMNSINVTASADKRGEKSGPGGNVHAGTRAKKGGSQTKP